MQSVGSYADREGVSRDFIDAHQGAAGKLSTQAGSATLIGDGLVLTAAHVPAGVGATLHMNYQLDENGDPLDEVLYPVLEVVESGDSGLDDWKILRVPFNPENRFGAATLARREPIVGEQIAFIGHPFEPAGAYANPDPALGWSTTWKVADVGTIDSIHGNVSFFRSLDIRGVASGGGVYDMDGELLALIKASATTEGVAYGGGDCSHDDNARQGDVTNLSTVYAYSETITGARGSGHFFSSNTGTSDALVQYPTSTSNWDSNWSQIVSGNFNNSGTKDLFFYSAARGVGEFMTMTPTGGLLVIGGHVNHMSNTWSQIIPVDLDGTGTTELLMYDANSHFGSFYGTDGAGRLTGEIKRNTGWQPDWRTIVSGNFTTRAGNELLFYGPGGNMVLYGMNASGTISRLSTFSIPDEASIIVAGRFGSTDGLDDILVYSPNGQHQGVTNIYRFAGTTPVLVSSYETPDNVTQIVAGDFTPSPGEGNYGDDLLYYTPRFGKVELFTVLDGALVSQTTQSTLRANFGKMVSGNFRAASPGTEVMFYDRFRLGN